MGAQHGQVKTAARHMRRTVPYGMVPQCPGEDGNLGERVVATRELLVAGPVLSVGISKLPTEWFSSGLRYATTPRYRTTLPHIIRPCRDLSF